jgi:hypothetical protein
VRARLAAEGKTPAELEAIDASVEAQVDEIEQRALAAPFPVPSTEPLPEFAGA